jgi:Ni/Fe-hydrogenase 1 B-type cytochrome subunit
MSLPKSTSSAVSIEPLRGYALLLAIVIHITGVIVTELREGGGIVSAMFTGRKVLGREPRGDLGEGT